ncbi:MAG: hypothetical protein ABEH86_09740 [Haloarcula sp.]
MNVPTLREIEVERDAVASVLDAVPGVAVVDDAARDSSVPTRAESPAEETGDDGSGLADRLASLWRQWGLLGTGLTLVALGAATIGLWWYRRRSTDEPAGESVATHGGDWDTDSTAETSPADSVAETSSPTPDDSRGDTHRPETRRTELATDATHSQSDESQRHAVTDEFPTTEPDAREAETATERPETTIDPAPILGVAFLILTGALGRWATSDRNDDR